MSHVGSREDGDGDVRGLSREDESMASTSPPPTSSAADDRPTSSILFIPQHATYPPPTTTRRDGRRVRGALSLRTPMSANPANILSTSPPEYYSYSPETLSPTTLSTRPAAETRSDSHQSTRSLYRMVGMDGALPENDGMASLRQKLQEVKQLAVSTEEKAKRMHFLMTQDYMKHKALHSPSEEEPVIPVDPENPFNLRPGDTDAVFSPLPKNPREHEGEGEDEIMDDDIPDLGCMHYKRNVKVQCFDCQRWFPCRHCHDQSNDLPFPHNLNRKKTRNMLCMLCETPQPAAEVCINCGNYAAYYFCPKCKLWDNDSNKRIYHCDDCGICRVGEGLGKDYIHCKRCNVCISISTSAAHPCIERATEGNCPLCLVQLFESRTSVVSLPCGHYMHGDCYKDLMAVTYKCPVCSKSAVNMELQWKKLDDEIATQPMPDEDEDLDAVMQHVEGQEQPAEAPATNGNNTQPRPRRPREVWVGCNDCGRRSWTPFHWLGLKCQKCDSYNTNQMAPTAVHETDAERLMRQQQTIHRHDFSGDAVLRDAGIGNPDPEPAQYLEVPESPSQQAAVPRGAQSPGRYFVHDEPPRRPSFTTARFSTPSMPNLPTLSDMPRMPRLPNLPNLQHMRDNMRQNLPNMPNVELPRFSPYEMIDSLSRSLSPMRYYLRGLDREDDERPMTAPTAGSKLVEDVGLWDSDERDLSPEDERDSEVMEEDEDESDGDEDEEMVDDVEEEEVVGKERAGKSLDVELIGHR